MYSAGPDEEALDFLVDPKKERNSLYTRRLLPLLVAKEISLVELAKRVQIAVESDAKQVGHQQRPAYFDGIVGHYYLEKLDASQKRLGPADRIQGDNVIRLWAYATWDGSCHSRAAPRVTVSPPRYGRVVMRYETFKVSEQRFGPTPCVGTTQRGTALYYFINPEHQSGSSGIENFQVDVRHWTLTPSVTTRDSFEVDLALKTAKRTREK
jgi:hypothetical protein